MAGRSAGGTRKLWLSSASCLFAWAIKAAAGVDVQNVLASNIRTPEDSIGRAVDSKTWFAIHIWRP